MARANSAIDYNRGGFMALKVLLGVMRDAPNVFDLHRYMAYGIRDRPQQARHHILIRVKD